MNVLTPEGKCIRIAVLSTWRVETFMKNIYLLKDLAKISGYSTHTLKFYLRVGLLEEIGRSPATNFRYFDDSNVRRLNAIRRLSSRGLSLKDISKTLASKNGT